MNKNVLFLSKESKRKSSYYVNKTYLSSKVENIENFLYMEILIKIPIFPMWVNELILILCEKRWLLCFEKHLQELKRKTPLEVNQQIDIPLSGPYWYDEILRLWHSCRCQQHPLFQPCPAWYQSQCNSQFVQHQHWKKLNKSKELQEACLRNLK